MSQVFHDIEKKILETLQKTPNQSPEQLSKNTELSIDQIRRGIEWLRLKDLALVNESEKITFSLGPNGLDSFKNGLPERKLINMLKEEPKTFEQIRSVLSGAGFNVAIANAKKNGWIKIEKNNSDSLVSIKEKPIETPEEKHPFKMMFKEFIGISPFGILYSEKPLKPLFINILFGSLIFLMCFQLTQITGDLVQWTAFGLGAYILTCWIQSLQIREPVTFEMIFGSKAFILSTIGFPFISFVTYSMAAFGPAFYMRNHGINEAEVATILGLMTAFFGTAGVIAGGVIGDKLREKYINGRLFVGFAVIVIAIPSGIAFLYEENLYLSYFYYAFFQIATPMWVGIAPATASDLVMPRMRGVAGAFYILMVSMLGLALGPYCVGKLSDIYFTNGLSEAEALRDALASGLSVLSITTLALIGACYYLPKEEKTRLERARRLGEEIN